MKLKMMKLFPKPAAPTVVLFLLFQTFLPAAARAQGRPVVSMASELKAFTDIAGLPAYREGTSLQQASSYDRTGGNDDGFSGRFSFVRRNRDSSLVLLDAKGPGVVNRIWTPTPTEDSIDFYIDDTARPAFTLHYKDLFSGTVYPFVAPLCNNQLGGYYCYLPLPFRQRCRIVLRGKHHQFYQIGYRTLPEGTPVESFKPQLRPDDKAALEQVVALWGKARPGIPDFYPGGTTGTLRVARSAIALKPGEAKTVLQLNTGGRIAGIELEPAAAFEGGERDVDIRITWDGETTPAVYCPVADFFGYAYGRPSMESLLLGSRGRINYCYLPMPFDRSAKIELLRRGGARTNADALNLTARIYYASRPRNAAREGKLYTAWNHQSSVPKGEPHVFLNATGKGHYVGTVLQTRGLEPGMTGFFEGDDSTVVDGKLTLHGTGSEDYFNGGWYAMMDRWDGAYSLPLSGSLDYTLPLSRTGGYRLFLTDKIPFARSIHHSIEHGPERNEAPATYTSVAFYYGTTPPAPATLPTAADTRVSLPDTMILFPQLLTYNTSGDLTIRRRWAYPTGGEAVIFTSPGESAVRVHLEGVPDGSYAVFLDYARHPQGCSFSLWQRQTPLTAWKPSDAGDTVRVEREHLSDLTLTPLGHTLTLRFRAEGDKNQFFLNRILLVRRKEQ
ncbi:MAG TPA: glycoside hydrolase family 172 protein [Chitinophagaceae bacterium]|jgi:hypothetical protein|nr:glycoside hydrolase family 172 protein [Chitinophagaceae bacterium]